MLLVNDNEAKRGERHALLEQRVGADDEFRRAVLDALQRFPTCHGALTAREPGRLDAKRPEPVGKTAPVLFGQQLGRRHDRCLDAAGNRLETGDCRDNGLSRANVTLNKAHHGMCLRQVAQYFLDHPLLCRCQAKRQVLHEVVHLGCAIRQGGCGFSCSQCTQVFQAQVMRE